MVDNLASYLNAKKPADEKKRIASHARTGRPRSDARVLERVERISGRCLKPRKSGPQAKEKAHKRKGNSTRKQFRLAAEMPGLSILSPEPKPVIGACLGVKNIGEPCAGKPHARFDEGGQA
jgi:hypothetical protein